MENSHKVRDKDFIDCLNMLLIKLNPFSNTNTKIVSINSLEKDQSH